MEIKKTAKDYLWKKGVSGNPAGKPCGAISIVAEIRKRLAMIVNQKTKKTYIQLVVDKIIKKAVRDEDVKMLCDLVDRVDGKPKQNVEMSGANGSPLVVEIVKYIDKKGTDEKS